MQRLIALTLITVLTLTGCASTIPERRAKWDTPGREAAEVSDQQFLTDDAACDTTADNKSRGMATASIVLNSVGILLWPLLVPGIILGGVAIGQSVSAKKTCMAERGYAPKGDVAPVPDAAPPTAAAAAPENISK